MSDEPSAAEVIALLTEFRRQAEGDAVAFVEGEHHEERLHWVACLSSAIKVLENQDEADCKAFYSEYDRGEE